jgi:hypothetical protein
MLQIASIELMKPGREHLSPGMFAPISNHFDLTTNMVATHRPRAMQPNLTHLYIYLHILYMYV